MTDEDVRKKFYECAEGLMEPDQIEAIIAACAKVEEFDRFSDLLALMRITGPR